MAKYDYLRGKKAVVTSFGFHIAKALKHAGPKQPQRAIELITKM